VKKGREESLNHHKSSTHPTPPKSVAREGQFELTEATIASEHEPPEYI